MAEPISVRLRCPTWKQLGAIYRRDLSRGELFLRAPKPPAIGAIMVVELILPSGSLVPLSGTIQEHVPPGGREGRGPGVIVALSMIAPATMWMIESALTAAGESRDAEPASGAAPGAAEPALQEDAAVGDAERDLAAALEEELAAMRKLNPFQVLDVPYDADDQAVRGAFGVLARRYHPDRFTRYAGGRARTCGSEIFLCIRNAYKQLSEPSSRHRVLGALGRDAQGRPMPGGARQRINTPPPIPAVAGAPAPVVPAGADVTQPMEPSPLPPAPRPHGRPERPSDGFGGLFNDLSQRNDGGSPLLTMRPARVPPTPVPAAAHASANEALERGDYERALQLFNHILRQSPSDAAGKIGIELATGLRALAQRDRFVAAERFERVLALDPTNERAARELAEMRRKNTTERTGMLSRLLGKERP